VSQKILVMPNFQFHIFFWIEWQNIKGKGMITKQELIILHSQSVRVLTSPSFFAFL